MLVFLEHALSTYCLLIFTEVPSFLNHIVTSCPSLYGSRHAPSHILILQIMGVGSASAVDVITPSLRSWLELVRHFFLSPATFFCIFISGRFPSEVGKTAGGTSFSPLTIWLSSGPHSLEEGTSRSSEGRNVPSHVLCRDHSILYSFFSSLFLRPTFLWFLPYPQ